ncbi:hypothetical protein SLE2022_043160 [Rubroshorea leprosula]
MECMEARALKSRELREQSPKSTQQVLLEDFCCLNGANGVPSDDFSVDCFLDFSAGEVEDGGSVEEEEEEEEKDSLSVSSQDNNSNSAGFSLDSLLTDELSVPTDDVAGLEWVSLFVDDSLSEFPPLCSSSKQKTDSHAKPERNKQKTDSHAKPERKPVSVKLPFFLLRAPTKARTKRPRTSGGGWSVDPDFLTDSSLRCSRFSEPPTKKQKKKQGAQTGGLPGGCAVQRRCSHCQVQKTPQWRTGPLGAKTLCNACGVRYKSGRLYPEYRPACSPTFSGDIHSNSHRKVLEIRKRKEKELAVEPGLNPVQSF